MSDRTPVHESNTATLDAEAPAEERGVLRPGEHAAYQEDVPLISNADDIDLGIMAPKRLTATLLNEQAHVLSNPEFNLYLHQTTINLGMEDKFYARVRIVNLADRAIVGQLPAEVREVVQRLFFGGDQRKPSQFGGRKMDQSLARSKEIAHAYGVAGFLEPRLVLRQEQVTDQEREAWVGSIALHDLQEFMRICEGDDSLAARRLERFLTGSSADLGS